MKSCWAHTTPTTIWSEVVCALWKCNSRTIMCLSPNQCVRVERWAINPLELALVTPNFDERVVVVIVLVAVLVAVEIGVRIGVPIAVGV